MAGTIVVDRIESDASYASNINVASQITFSNTVNLTVASTFPAGTVGAPSITTSGDTNTGIFFPAADTIAFSEGGAEAMRIDSSGNVGIGTASPNSKLTSQTATTSTSVFSFATQLNNSHASNSSISALGFHNRADVNATGVGGAIAFSGGGTSDGSGNLVFCVKPTGNIATVVAPSDEKMRIDSSGNLLVGTTSALGKITSSSSFDTGANWDTTAALSTTGSFGGALAMVDGSRGYGLYCSDNGNDFYIQGATSLSSALTGGVYLNDRATSWSSASDERLKTIIEPITDAVSKVCQLRTVIGRYNYEPEGKRHPFLIAQDVQAVLPEAVSVTDKQSEEQYLGISYTDTIPLLVASIKELKAIVDAQATRIAALESN